MIPGVSHQEKKKNKKKTLFRNSHLLLGHVKTLGVGLTWMTTVCAQLCLMGCLSHEAHPHWLCLTQNIPFGAMIRNTRHVRPCVTRQFRVLIRRRNRPDCGRTGPDRRPLYNFDQRSLVSLSVSGQSVCDGGYQGWYLCGCQTCFEKKPNIHLELSGTRRFFEVFSPTQTGGSFWFC